MRDVSRCPRDGIPLVCSRGGRGDGVEPCAAKPWIGTRGRLPKLPALPHDASGTGPAAPVLAVRPGRPGGGQVPWARSLRRSSSGARADLPIARWGGGDLGASPSERDGRGVPTGRPCGDPVAGVHDLPRPAQPYVEHSRWRGATDPVRRLPRAGPVRASRTHVGHVQRVPSAARGQRGHAARGADGGHVMPLVSRTGNSAPRPRANQLRLPDRACRAP